MMNNWHNRQQTKHVWNQHTVLGRGVAFGRNVTLTARRMPVKRWGSASGRDIFSCSTDFAPSNPATALHDTPGVLQSCTARPVWEWVVGRRLWHDEGGSTYWHWNHYRYSKHLLLLLPTSMSVSYLRTWCTTITTQFWHHPQQGKCTCQEHPSVVEQQGLRRQGCRPKGLLWQLRGEQALAHASHLHKVAQSLELLFALPWCCSSCKSIRRNFNQQVTAICSKICSLLYVSHSWNECTLHYFQAWSQPRIMP